MNVGLSLGQPALYQICVQGYLGDRWSGMFEGMTLITDATQGTTALIGVVPDQAALHGILARIRDLGLPLLSLMHIADEQLGDEAGRATAVTDSGASHSTIYSQLSSDDRGGPEGCTAIRSLAGSAGGVEGTARNHISSIFGELEARDRAQAVARAKELGMI